MIMEGRRSPLPRKTYRAPERSDTGTSMLPGLMGIAREHLSRVPERRDLSPVVSSRAETRSVRKPGSRHPGRAADRALSTPRPSHLCRWPRQFRKLRVCLRKRAAYERFSLVYPTNNRIGNERPALRKLLRHSERAVPGRLSTEAASERCTSGRPSTHCSAGT